MQSFETLLLWIQHLSEAPESAAVRGFLLHVFHRTHGPATVIFGVGRLETGETFAFADHRDQPAFYVRASDASTARVCAGGADDTVSPCEWTTMDGEPVVRVASRRLNHLRRIAERLRENDIRTYEVDVSLARRYLADRGIRGPVEITGQYRAGTGVDRVYTDPELQAGDWVPELSLLALDIETLPDASEVLAASLVGSGFGKVAGIEEIHVVGAPAADDPPHLFCHRDERALLTALGDRIRALDPDVITGWNLVDFDLTVLQRRFRALALPFNLGRSSDSSWYQEGEIWGGSRMVVYGRQVLDALHLIRATLQRFDDYRLETVAQQILGRGKRFEASADADESMPERILQSYREDRAAFCEYCLEDARLVRDILKAEGLIELSLQRSVLTGLPLERAWGSVAAFDFLYISELHSRGKVAPTNGVDRVRLGGAPGGLVMPATAGLYRNIFVFDFKSLYPSIMRTFNIDPLAHIEARVAIAGEADGDRFITAPNGARFGREPGILPQLLDRFFDSREQAKAAGDELASYAYKIVMNSFYGVLATDACRFAEEQLAGAITEFGHYFLRWTRDLLEQHDCRVLYGDTDSVFVDAGLPEDVDPGEGIARGAELCAWINRHIAEHIRAEHQVDSVLDLEFEKFYRRFFLPPIRDGGDRGRAKGYAGLIAAGDGSERVEIVGMEAVRRDWTDLARELQRDLLARLFRDAPSDEIEAEVSEWIRGVRAGERDGQLIYRKALRKPVDDYTSSSPPHVTAARLLPNPSGLIQYVMTRDGPQPTSATVSPLDYEHYIEKQIKPIVRTIGQVCDLDVEAAITGMPDLFRSLR